MLCLLFVHTFSFHLNIDFGSQYIKSSIVSSKEKPKIACVSDTIKLTPSYIALRSLPTLKTSGKQLTIEDALKLKPVFGNDALILMLTKPNLGTAYLSSYVGLLQEESDRISNNLFFNNSAAPLSLVDFSSLFFDLYINSISHGKVVHSVSVVVPSTFTIPQRRYIENLIRGCGFNFQSIFDDTEAISTAYLMDNYGKFSRKPKTVLFIDIGSTSIKSYCIKFEYNEEKVPQATRLSYEILNEQGGAYLTLSMVNLIQSKYNLSNLTLSEHQKLFNAAEKIKIKLTTLLSASYLVENIQNNDLNIKLTRYELETVSGQIIDHTIETAKKASAGISFDDIEVIGGSSRVPIIWFSIQNAFNVNSIGNSLDTDHSLSIGSGYYTQTKNGFSEKEIVVKSLYSPYNVSLKYHIVESNNENDEGKGKEYVFGDDENTNNFNEDYNNRNSNEDDNNRNSNEDYNNRNSNEDDNNRNSNEDDNNRNSNDNNIDNSNNLKILSICKQKSGCIDEVLINDTFEKFEIVYDNANESLLETTSFGYKVNKIKGTTVLIKFSKTIPIYPIYARRCDKEGKNCRHITLEQIILPSSKPTFTSISSARQEKQKIEASRDKLEILALRVIKQINTNSTIQTFSSLEDRKQIKLIAGEALKLIRERFDTVTNDRDLTSYYNIIKNDMRKIDNRINENMTLERSIFIMNQTISYAKQKLKKWRTSSNFVALDGAMGLAEEVETAKKWFQNAINEIKNTPVWKDRKVKSKDFNRYAKQLNQYVVNIANKIPNDEEDGNNKAKNDDPLNNFFEYLGNSFKNYMDGYNKGKKDDPFSSFFEKFN